MQQSVPDRLVDRIMPTKIFKHTDELLMRPKLTAVGAFGGFVAVKPERELLGGREDGRQIDLRRLQRKERRMGPVGT